MRLHSGDGAFWVGDIVEGQGEQQYVNGFILDDVMQLTSEYHPAWTGGYLGIPPGCYKYFRLVQRGNFWLQAHSWPLLPFDSLSNEAYFYVAVGLADVVQLEAKTEVEILRQINDRKVDGFFTRERSMMAHLFTSWYAVKLRDRVLGQKLAERTLDFHRYKMIRRRITSVLAPSHLA